jgi:chromosomal replication initiation ATPase DnaA
MIIPKIKEIVTSKYGLNPIDMRKKSRKENVARCRQLCIYFFKRVLGMSDGAVAKEMGVDRSYVYHAQRRISGLRDVDFETRMQIEGIEDQYPVLRGERDLV